MWRALDFVIFKETFVEEHDRLYGEAKAKSEYSTVTAHYYSVMSAVIDEYFNGNFHFAPPRYRQQLLTDALKELHERIAHCLKLTNDIGCGIGGVMNDLAFTGANLTGVTIAGNEVTIGNKRFENQGLVNCNIVHGIIAAYHCRIVIMTVYALKYLEDLKPALQEVNRILRPGDFFLKEMISAAKIYDFELAENIDLDRETGNPYYFCFSHSSLFMWLINSSLVDWIISIAQAFHIMPKGFLRFKQIFLAGTVNNIVHAGKLGILSGSEILLFQKIK
ncbi:Sterol 4-C-methyltransferase strm-1 [Dirofilaria immitis]|nr:Sterol 4-C-methyltransferase strm-1 [Dirofilaria immitis]